MHNSRDCEELLQFLTVIPVYTEIYLSIPYVYIFIIIISYLFPTCCLIFIHQHFTFFILCLICGECWLCLMLDTLVMKKYKVLIERKIIVVPSPKSSIKTFLLIQAITLAVLWFQRGLILTLLNWK